MNKRLLFASVAAVAMTSQVFATHGINLIGIGPIQQGTAGAGVASAKDSTWLVLNPAGLTDIQPSVDASLQVFAPSRSVDSTMSGGAGEQKDNSVFFIPQISGSFGCCHAEKGFVGIGVYGTSGMGVDYDKGRIGQITNPGPPPTIKEQNDIDKRTQLSIAKITLTYAYKLEHGWSIGAGPLMVISRFRTDMIGPDFTAGSDDWDTSYGGGAIFGINKHFDRFTLGGSYMSKQWMSKFDEYNNLFADALNLPQQITVGGAWNILDNLELALDYEWLDWSGVDTFDKFGWDSQHIVKAGATWSVNDAFTLRTGVSYGKSPINDDNAFINALFPAIMEMHFACGASYVWDKWAVNIAYIHAFENSVRANGEDMPYGMGKGTKIEMYQNSLTLGATYHF